MTRVLVVGDVMIDEYVTVDVSRISQEAPIPVMRFLDSEQRPGGAANVAKNLLTMGCDVVLLGVVGTIDESVVNTIPMWTDCVVDRGRCTTVKRRFVTQSGHQVARFDKEDVNDISTDAQQQLIKKIRLNAVECDVIVVSDYCKGVITEDVAEASVRCRAPVIVDTKQRDWSIFYGADIFTPNLAEWLALNRAPTSDTRVVITMGDLGAKIWRPRGDFDVIPPHKVEKVADVTGAGDTFVAALAKFVGDHGWRDNRPYTDPMLHEAVHFANKAAAIAVSKRGTYAVTKEDLDAVK